MSLLKFKTREKEKINDKAKSITPEEYMKKQQELMKQFDMMQQKAFQVNNDIQNKSRSR